MNFLKNFSNGHYSLVKTFWLYGLLPLSIYSGVIAAATSQGASVFTLNILKVPGLIYLLLWTTGTWLSAKKYKGLEIWKLLAQAYVFLVVVGFLWAITSLGHHVLQRVAFSAVSTGNQLEDGVAASRHGDYQTALRLLRPFAEQGDIGAQAELGMIYEHGLGVPENHDEGVKWYLKAADQGDPIAEAFAKEETSEAIAATNRKDYVVAFRLLRPFADHGVAEAEYKIGNMYENGFGVPQDYVEAHKWYNLAATDEKDKIFSMLARTERDQLAAKMTPEQIAEAQRLAGEWKPK